jgi:hypothetical protein
MGTVGRVEGQPDRGGGDGVLAARDRGQRVPHPGNAATLPGGFEHAGDGGLQTGMGVADHQPDSSQSTGAQRSQELGPKRLGLRGTDAQTDDLAATFRVGG